MDTRFVVPSPNQFKATIAEELLMLTGSRELISLIQRAEGQGPWGEKVEITKQSKDKNGKYKDKIIKVSKLGRELSILLRAKKANVKLSDNDGCRREELLKLTSVPDKTDDELKTNLEKWIFFLRTQRNLPTPLPDEFLEAYEFSFKPRVIKSDT